MFSRGFWVPKLLHPNFVLKHTTWQLSSLHLEQFVLQRLHFVWDVLETVAGFPIFLSPHLAHSLSKVLMGTVGRGLFELKSTSRAPKWNVSPSHESSVLV
jgi:hypothetical protein